MDNTPSVSPANTNTALFEAAAKDAFSEFIRQITKTNAKGLISEGNGQKIFSFETYLRDKGRPEETINGFCSYIKSIENTAEKDRIFKITDYRVWMRSLGYTTIPGVVLYLLITALLWTFDISFLNWVPFILFALSGPVIFMLLYLSQYLKMKSELRSGKPLEQYIIKYFDNDEVTFVKAKSRLFVEK